MESVYDVAQYVYAKYKEISGQNIDEMKLHKLLYYIQRESFAIIGEPMFDAEFSGWKYGPVCLDIRLVYTVDGINTECKPISFESAYIVNNVISEFGAFESWKLSELSHKETSWINSRKGLRSGEIGNKLIKLTDIKADARKVRAYDHIWDMYYDEFDDIESIKEKEGFVI